MIYLDNSATTKPFSSIVESFTQVTKQYFGNPSSIHHLGGQSEKLLTSARDQVAQLLEVNSEEIIFTSGGTEGNNMVIKGIAYKHQNRGKHMITTAIEHPSVLETFQQLEREGFHVTYLPVNEAGQVNVDDVEQAITDETILLSIMHVNNEIGSIMPLVEIGALAKKYPKLFFHVDAVQSVGKIPLMLKNSGIDSCTISGHKIHGLKGTGILYMNEKMALQPLFTGGAQEFGIRSGTENLAGAVAMARALRLIKEKETTEQSHLLNLHELLINGFEKMPDVVINSPNNGAPHIVNISLPGFKPEVVIHALGEENIFISTKSACSSKRDDESHVLMACGFDQERASSALRISTSYDTTTEDIKAFLQVFQQTIQRLKMVME
ncbi:MAG TPA: cysteine desulfurase family protein [Bacillota bacterium]|nr:cysteine desulfurase family protein [Bacillota bacterium]